MTRREAMRGMLARRERQGLTFRELSEQTGTPVGTLAFWAWKLRQGSGGVRATARRGVGFVELVAASEQGSREGSGSIEVVLSNGRRVLVHGEIDEARLLRVVQALERC